MNNKNVDHEEYLLRLGNEKHEDRYITGILMDMFEHDSRNMARKIYDAFDREDYNIVVCGRTWYQEHHSFIPDMPKSLYDFLEKELNKYCLLSTRQFDRVFFYSKCNGDTILFNDGYIGAKDVRKLRDKFLKGYKKYKKLDKNVGMEL